MEIVPVLQGVLVFLLAYSIGSFPTAYVVGRLNGVNIFHVGSGNMGATNVLRALGLRWGAAVLVIDAAKGILAVLVSRLLPGDATTNSVIGAIAAVVGHNWSLIATLITGKVRGGKGAATAGGTWLVLFAPWWYLIIVPLSVLIAVVLATRYVSLGVLTTVLVAALGVLLSLNAVPQTYLIYVGLIVIMIYYRHRENIQRLIEGRERRLGDPA